MRVEQTFRVDSDPETLFDYMADPDRLPEWQYTKTEVEQLTPGEVGEGTRFREVTEGPFGRTTEQVTEFAEFDRPRRLKVAIVEGPIPVDGSWELAPDGGGTTVTFVADGELSGFARLAQPIVCKLVLRQFADYHRRLKENVERIAGPR